MRFWASMPFFSDQRVGKEASSRGARWEGLYKTLLQALQNVWVARAAESIIFRCFWDLVHKVQMFELGRGQKNREHCEP